MQTKGLISRLSKIDPQLRLSAPKFHFFFAYLTDLILKMNLRSMLYIFRSICIVREIGRIAFAKVCKISMFD